MKHPIEKISVEQKKVMIEFMENHKEIANVTYKQARSSLNYELWNQLTAILNATPGPKKDKMSWQKVWTGIKTGMKTKLKKLQIYHDKLTGQYIFYPRLNEIDERIISLTRHKSINNELDMYTQNLNYVNDPKIKEEHPIINMNVSPVPTIVREQILGDVSDNSVEGGSTSSWNSHVADSRSSSEQPPNNMNTFSEKLNTIMVQLEQIIEQKSVSNILLGRIASSLEHSNNE